MSELQKILCVDDEPNILNGLQRQLRKHFDVHTAESGKDGLNIIKNDGPFSVVVSDMRMPEMDGAEFLTQVKYISPTTTRLLLTGQSDAESAKKAINEGEIFRFLSKPCPPEVLVDTIENAVEHSRLRKIEKELLENTLHGAVKTLTEILEIVNPSLFATSSHIEFYAKGIASELGLANSWQIGIAAMLSHIGYITLPDKILGKLSKNEELEGSEKDIFANHTKAAYKLLINIPRLDKVAEIVKGQLNEWKGDHLLDELSNNYIEIGSQIIAISIEIDRRISNGINITSAINELIENKRYSNTILNLCKTINPIEANFISKELSANELRAGMIIDSDILDINGAKLVGKGIEISEVLIMRLTNFSSDKRLTNKIAVKIPT
jgi:response regulator RpfG family c-di-GMP phosphodiesterase